MKSKNMNMLVRLALVVTLTLAGMIPAIPAVVATAHSEEQAGKLEGTWRVQVTIRDCQSGAALRTFPALLTFAQGGTLTETTTGFSPALRTPGHGFWQHTGDHSYSAVSEAFLFNQIGIWTATQRLTQSIEIADNPDELTSTATNEIFDTSGNLLMAGCATAVASRLQ